MWNVLGKLPLRGIKTFSELSFSFFGKSFLWTRYFLDTDIPDKCDAAEVSTRTSDKLCFVGILMYFKLYCCGWNSFLSSVADSLSCSVMQNVQPKASPVVSTVVSGASSTRMPPAANRPVEPVASVTQPSELLQQKGIWEILLY